MSAIMERGDREGNMNLKESVRHMGNAFLNGVETPQQKAAFLALQMAVTRMSRVNIYAHITT